MKPPSHQTLFYIISVFTAGLFLVKRAEALTIGPDISSIKFTARQHSEIANLISEEKVLMFSKSTCPYCSRAKSIFKGFDVDVTIVELNLNPDPDYMPRTQAILLDITKQKTVPNIFIGGVHIGGHKNLRMLADSGELKSILDAADVSNSIG